MRYDESGNELAYICCFCGAPIDDSDKEAVQLIATNLWAREAAQAVYAHSNCASEKWSKDNYRRTPFWTLSTAIRSKKSSGERMKVDAIPFRLGLASVF